MENYKAILAQLAKMKMSFISFHIYSEGRPNAEPTVWIGKKNDHINGKVQHSYPSSYQSTVRGNWQYASKLTSNYHFGSQQLFARDSFSSPLMNGYMLYPENQKESNALFNKTGSMLNEAFNFAHEMRIKPCVGTETPLIIPEVVKERLKKQGKNPSDPETVKNLYQGMLERIQYAYLLDYYCLWTDDGWTWNEVSQQQIATVKQDLNIALEAINLVRPGFEMATCGWVLGPLQDRILFDKILPKRVTLNCINREVEFTPVDTYFAKILNRTKWMIPWLEDEPAMISPQLWAGCMRNDNLDACQYGCTGLIGIHWRTKILSPNISVLAEAAWDQRGWKGEKRTKRDQSVQDFYRQWVSRQFGPNITDELTDIFVKLNGGPLYQRNFGEGRSAHLYRTSTWIHGPGSIRKTRKPWDLVRQRFAFIVTLMGFQSKIEGKNNKTRYVYWLNTFRFACETEGIGCILGKMGNLMEVFSEMSAKEAKKRIMDQTIFPLRIEAAEVWKKMSEYLLKTVSTTGTTGTITNVEQHNLKKLNMLTRHDSILKEHLDKEWPEEASLSHAYEGFLRIIVPSKRSLLEKDENFKLKIRILLQQPINMVQLYWKPLGNKNYNKKKFKHIKRGVYKTKLNHEKINKHDFEYYVKAVNQSDKKTFFPVNPKKINHTIVIKLII
ncbi:MAG: hypothetical protein ACQERS_08130 [Bacteroidota bacterium]